MADEEKKIPENDDWLNDFNESNDEIDTADNGQADFDELFDSFESGEHGTGQENPPVSSGGIVEEEELDQASIDALLGDSFDSAAAPSAADPVQGGGDPDAGLDQSDIDALLGNSVPGAASAEPAGEKGEDPFAEISSGAAAGPFTPEAVDFEEVLGVDTGDEEFDGSELDDEFDFGDEILDSLEEDEALQAVDDTPLDDLFAEEPVAAPPKQPSPKQPPPRDISEDATVLSTPTVSEKKPAAGSFIPAILAKINIKKAAIGVFLLLLVIGGVGLIMNSIGHRGGEPAILLPDQEGVTGSGYDGQQAMINRPPEAKNGEASIAADAAQVEIRLEASDPEGAKLVYEIVSPPEYGTLSGEPPQLVYQADNKFTGRDRFEYRVSDGSQASAPAAVAISGPDIAARLAGPVVIEPKHPVLKARDQEIAALSTEPVIIDWRTVWGEENDDQMKDVTVEVSADGLKGKLTRLDRYRHRYEPDPFSAGLEELKFRFKKRGVSSKQRKMEMQVASGNPPPDLIVVALDKERYRIGETVVIDASKSRDDKRESLIFEWRQVAGVPVYFNRLNDEGSRVSFTMPSSFYTTDYPEPIIRLTAVDVTGKTANREIRVGLEKESFRQAALWDGLQKGQVIDPECPSGFCPGSRLP
ncbi:MAG: hypothetical protein KKG47_15410 [Proteobacteria bacterium]|nr:hypothetical protein [Pseudomonadota bacterium]MBU1737982.1 hypothetical protein [Pseudomonadota bacterium]